MSETELRRPVVRVAGNLELMAKIHYRRSQCFPEKQYRWCDRHSLSYSVNVHGLKGRRNIRQEAGECPLCWRERMIKEGIDRRRKDKHE
jgi:hypothetical protein